MTNVKEYKPLILGKITRFEAGVIYRAMKENNIEVLPETIKTLYDEANVKFAYYQERYCQDSTYFDEIYKATEYILQGDYDEAQKRLIFWQDRRIESASKNSLFFKYKN